MSIRHPAVDLISCAVHLFDFIMYQMLFSIMHIEKIKNYSTLFFNAVSNSPYGIVMFPARSKIAEGGKEIKSVIKVIDPERKTHIMLVKFQMIIFVLLGIADTVK